MTEIETERGDDLLHLQIRRQVEGELSRRRPQIRAFHAGAAACRDGASLTSLIAEVLEESGVQLARLRVGVEVNHPTLLAIAWVWDRENGVEEKLIRHNVISSPDYLASPVRAVKEREIPELRITGGVGFQNFAMPKDFERFNCTDYFVLPLRTSKIREDVITVATDAPAGFTDEQVSNLRAFSIRLAPYAALQAERILAKTISQVYLGEKTGTLVTGGQIRRGNVDFIDAAVWFSDLRDFTSKSEVHTPAEIVTLLNTFFDAVDTAVRPYGGEILKLMGDAAMVVFRDGSGPNPCERALAAAREMHRQWPGSPTGCGADLILNSTFGIGLHFGRVIYGNIGSASRLDFTVIGRDVNIASRISSKCSDLGVGIACSEEFSNRCNSELSRLGCHPLRGLEDCFELFNG